jgi:hypothetical protein
LRAVLETKPSDDTSPKDCKVPAIIAGRREKDGAPIVRLVPREEITAPHAEPVYSTQADAEILNDVHVLRTSSPIAFKASEVQVPAERMLMNPDELALIGDGLPIIRGVRTLDILCNHDAKLVF